MLPIDLRERSHHEAARLIVRMLAHGVLAQTVDLDDPSAGDHDDDEDTGAGEDAADDAAHAADADLDDGLGDPSGVAATSLTEACVALRDALSLFQSSLVGSGDDPTGHANTHLAKEASRRHRRARALLARAKRRLAAVAAAEDLAGWVEARLGPETAPVVAGYSRLEHARGARDVARARSDARRAAKAVLRAYPSVSRQFDGPPVERFDRVLSGHLRRCLAEASEALETAVVETRRAAKYTRRLSLLLGLCAAADFSDAVNDDAAKALRVCHTLTRSLRPKVTAAAIETVLGAAGLSALVDPSQISQLGPAPDRTTLGARHLELLARVEPLVQALETAPTDIEIERKYLLHALPPRAAEAGALLQLRQGYVPGARLHERVRAVTEADSTTYLRTIKLGRGIKRVEIEEATSEPIFEALWELTEGKRVVKRRYEVREGDLLWQIDAFDDRELFLAEVELDDPHQLPTLPAWLAPYVVREVTNEREYVNLNLAR